MSAQRGDRDALSAAEVIALFAAPDGVTFNRRLRVISSAIWTAPSRFTTAQITFVAAYAKVVGPLDTAPLPGPDVVEVLASLLRTQHPDLTAAQRRVLAHELLEKAVAARTSTPATTSRGSA